VRIYRAGGRFKPCPQAMMFYRQVEGSRNKLTADTPPDFIENLRKDIIGIPPDPLDEVKATFYSQPTPGPTYVRCQLPARYLPGIVRQDPLVNFGPEGEVEFPEHRGAAIMQFAANKVLAVMLEHMRLGGIRTLIEVDDDYLIDPGKRILARSQWGLEIGDEMNTRDGHIAVVRRADGVIVTTDYLAEQYREFNDNVYICPNSVDPVDWPEPEKPNDGILRIAWFASHAHETDVPLITRAFEWASKQKDVEVYIAGLNPAVSFNKAIRLRWRSFKFGWLPWFDDLDAYRASFSRFDVGVAPVLPTEHGLGHSDLKMLEIAMGESFGICSAVAPYAWWKDKPCLMAADAGDFLKHIQWAVANRDEVRRLAKEARELVLRERTTEAQIHLWEEAVAA
jgi:hypothetical protein